jgi:microcystin-dependent protein
MSMPGVSMPNGPGSASHGAAQKSVRVQTVEPSTRIATCIDNLGKTMQIRYDIMRSKGNMPEPGETWIVDRQLFNTWTFAAIITGTTDGVTVATVNGLPDAIQTINTTTAANFLLRPTGTMEATLLSTPPAGALFLLGQIVNRADYPNLWAWVQNNSLLRTGLFGPANGVSTFGLPNFSGLILRGAVSPALPGALVGSDSLLMSQSQMPSHTHSTVHSSTHTHGFTTGNAGGHGGHFPANVSSDIAAAGTAYGFAPWNDSGQTGGDHGHSGTTGGDGTYFHNVASAGGTATIDMRQASVAVNWMIWT